MIARGSKYEHFRGKIELLKNYKHCYCEAMKPNKIQGLLEFAKLY